MATDPSRHLQFQRSNLATMQKRRALGEIDANVVEAWPYRFADAERRGFSGENALLDKQPLCPENRQVQRKFLVPVAPKPPFPEETKKKARLLPDSLDLGQHNAIPGDVSKPATIRQTEAIPDSIHQMEEIEMKDAFKDQILDIDICDKKDPLAVTEYVDDVFQFYKKAEGNGCILPNYMDHHFDINERMRAILIDWLIEVHYKFQLMDETLYLTVNLIDRFLSLHPIVRKKLQLVGVTALLVACKYEEVSVPVVEDLVLITDRAYSRKEVLDMERLMVNKLQFNMSVPNPYVFVRRFLKAAQSDNKLELVAFFVMELCLVEYEMLKFPPSLLAASAVYTAQCTLGRSMSWSKTCEYYTGYSEELLIGCSKRMVAFHQKAGRGGLTGVYRKYSMSKFGFAARAEPASFLLDALL